jgi:hypothetical protein
LFRRFKKIAVDYEDYEQALEALMDLYEKQPHFEKKPLGKYAITK